jgi:hypothetical protein
MPLYGVRGDAKEVNRSLLFSALAVAPALFVDPANCTNIHQFLPDSAFSQIFVVPGESLYRFKPTLLKLPYYAKKLNTKQIFISVIPHLYDYGNTIENQHIISQCWQIINWLSKRFTLTIGIVAGTIHENLAKKYNIKYKVGHTIKSQRVTADILLKELESFGKALREEDRKVYLQLLQQPLKHIGSISYTSSHHVWSFLLLAIILEQQKKISELQ